MAFLTNEDMTQFLRDIWPSRLRRAIKLDPENIDDDVQWHQILPVKSLALSEFLRVLPRNWPDFKDRTRPYTVVTAPDVNEDSGKESADVYEFKLRIQGFLGKHNLGHLGTWETKPEVGRASRAVQYVELHGGDDEDCAKVWAETIERANHLCNVVANKVRIGQYEPTFDPKKGKLHFQRRVFVRSEPETGAINTPVPAQVSHLKDEIFAAAKQGWFINTNRNAFGQVNRAGYLQRAANFPFEEGQFVDVTAAIDIVRRDNHPLSVKLRLERIVLLDTAGVPKKRNIRPAAPIVKQRPEPAFFELNEDEGGHDVDGEIGFNAPQVHAAQNGNNTDGNASNAGEGSVNNGNTGEGQDDMVESE